MTGGAHGRGSLAFWAPVLVAALLAALVLAPLLMQRMAAEAANRSVELVADLEEFETFALREGIRLETVLARLAESGLTSLAVPEMTPERLVRRGEATLLSGAELLARARSLDGLAPLLVRLVEEGEVRAQASYLLMSDDEAFAQATAAGCRRLAQGCRVWRDGGLGLLEVDLHVDRFRQLPLGLWPGDLQLARDHGLAVVARFADNPAATPASIRAVFAEVAQAARLTGVIFAGEAVLGAAGGRDTLAATAGELRDRRLTLGLIESPLLLGHIPQRGMEALLDLALDRAARVYSIPPDYLARLDPGEAVDIWVRAPKERNIRILYLRPLFSEAQGTRLETTAWAVRTLVQRLEQEGWQLGQAGTFSRIEPPAWALAVLFLGVAAASVALAARWLRLGPGWQAVGLALVTGGLAFLGLLAGADLAREAAALLLAIVVPTLAADVVLGRWAQRRPAAPSAGRSLIAAGAGDALVAAVLVLAGGLLMSGLFADTRYMLELRYFRGVKLSFVLPPVLTVLAFAWRFGIAGGGDAAEGSLGQRWRVRIGEVVRWLDTGVRWEHVLWAALVLVVAAVYLLRSGNLTRDFVPAYELLVRQALEEWLVARPRFKEFLLGHPAVLLGGWLVARGRQGYLWLTAVGGSIGFVSMLNSFEHVRTPVVISLLRGLNGLWLGLVLGAVLVAVVELLARRGILPGAAVGQEDDGP